MSAMALSAWPRAMAHVEMKIAMGRADEDDPERLPDAVDLEGPDDRADDREDDGEEAGELQGRLPRCAAFRSGSLYEPPGWGTAVPPDLGSRSGGRFGRRVEQHAGRCRARRRPARR